MDDLIRRSDAISAFCNKECSWGISHNYDCYDDCALRKKFMDIPVVELVRCGNCKKWNRERAKKNHIHFMGYCERLGGYSKREHYCAWAERKKEAQTDMRKVIPVICAECDYASIHQKYLFCELAHRTVYDAKPKWCPLLKLFVANDEPKNEQTIIACPIIDDDALIYEDEQTEREGE